MAREFYLGIILILRFPPKSSILPLQSPRKLSIFETVPSAWNTGICGYRSWIGAGPIPGSHPSPNPASPSPLAGAGYRNRVPSGGNRPSSCHRTLTPLPGSRPNIPIGCRMLWSQGLWCPSIAIGILLRRWCASGGSWWRSIMMTWNGCVRSLLC